MYSFPGAAVTNYHQHRDLKKQKKTGIYSLIVPKATNLKSRCWQTHAPSEGSGKKSFLASSSFLWLQSLVGSWLQNSCHCFCLYMAFAFFSPCLSSVYLLKGHLSLDLGSGWVILSPDLISI